MLANFGSNLRSAREEAGLTQAELARACDGTTAWISRLESGLRDPSFTTCVRLARALDIPLASLIEGVR